MFFNRSKDHVFFQILSDAADNISEATRLFRENVNTLEEKEKYAERLKELESKGDEYTHLLIQELNQTFVTPLDREDMLQLAVKLDDVMDGVESCASRFVMFGVEKSTPYLVQFAEILERSSEFLKEALQALEKRDYATIQRITVELNMLENEGDRVLRESITTLFKNPTDPVHLLRMKEIYEKLEMATDTVEDLADVLESVVMKYA